MRIDGVAHRNRCAQVVGLVVLLLLTAAPIRQPTLHAAQQAVVQPQSNPCAPGSAVPARECAALVELYMATDGANWLNHAGWLASGAASPCDWFGVVCAGGHVVELNLSRNRLNGTFPKAFGGLPALKHLALAGNQLHGVVPQGICTLAERRATADLAYNALFTARQATRNCLNQLDADWAATQTASPHAVSTTQIESTAVQLAWTPIADTTHGGFYEVSYATAHDGPFVTHGRTADKRAASYRLTGLAPGTTYFVRVQTVTPAHANNPTEVRSDDARTVVVTRASASILLIVYFPADNDLSPQVPTVLERLRKGSQYNPNVHVVLLSDLQGFNNTQVVTIANGIVTPTNAVFARWKTHELDTADPQILGWFLGYARDSFPADRTIVALMGHGLALAPEIEWVDTGQNNTQAAHRASKRIPPLPIGLDPTPGDITDRGYMSTVDLGRALAAATNNGAKPFDLLFLDQCFQGNLDTLYEIRSAADIFIASPNYAWLVAPYDQYLALLAPASTTEQIANAIITRYQRGLNDRHPNVIFGLRRADIEAVAGAVSALGEALLRASRAGEKNIILEAATKSQYVDTTQCGRENMTLGPPDQLIGAASFANNLHEAYSSEDPYGVGAAATGVWDALKPIHKSTRVGHPYLAPGELWDYTNTLTILAPLPPNSPAAVAWRSSIYTESIPQTATWTPVPTMTVQVTASFAYVRDGSWDEFLAEWYDAPLAPTVGEWCHYIPPAIVDGDDLEPLALDAAKVGKSAVRLTWNPTTHQDAAVYWRYEWNPFTVSWVARESYPIGQTSDIITNLVPDTPSRFLLVAQDAEGVAVAQSNAIEWPML